MRLPEGAPCRHSWSQCVFRTASRRSSSRTSSRFRMSCTAHPHNARAYDRKLPTGWLAEDDAKSGRRSRVRSITPRLHLCPLWSPRTWNRPASMACSASALTRSADPALGRSCHNHAVRSKIERVEPVLNVRDVAAATSFYAHLGFVEQFRDDPDSPMFVIVSRD